MSEKIRKLKEDASRLIAKGKLEDACECYEKVVKMDHQDLTARQKLAEIYARMGKSERAVHLYQSVAGSYAADGLLLKAIAVCKILLQIDPSHTETQGILADLSSRRRGGRAVNMPKAMSAALAGAKKSGATIRGVDASQIRGVPSNQVRRGGANPPDVVPAVDPRAIPVPASVDSGMILQSQAAPPGMPPPPGEEGPPVALGRSASTSVEDLQAAAAAMLPTPSAAAVAASLPTIEGMAIVEGQASVEEDAVDDSFAIDITFDDPEPVVLDTVKATTTEVGAPILTAAIQAALPSFDELMDMTADVGDAMAPSVQPEASHAAVAVPADVSTDRGFAEISDVGFADAPVADDFDGDGIGGDDPSLLIDDSGSISDDGDDGEILDLGDENQAIDVGDMPPIPLFSDLPRDAFMALTERMDLKVASTGEALITEGEAGTAMFIIIQGRVKVVRDDHGTEVQLAQLSDGTFFGEMALLSDAPRTASVVCVEETMLFAISREMLADITTKYPSVGEVMKKFHKNRLITNLLKTSPIFAPFSTSDKKLLIEKFKSRQVSESAYLITREKPGDGLYVVLSGRCEVLDVNSTGKEVVIAELKEGDVFGEMSMLWNKDTCASVRATTTCTVLRLPRTAFSEVIMTHPQILETLSSLSEKRLKENAELKAAGVVMI